MAKFQIFNGTNQQTYYRLRADNNEIILSSESYKEYYSTLNAIASVRINSQIKERFENRLSGNEYYFVLKAANGEIIGVSERYKSTQGRDNGIQAVIKCAPSAPIEDNRLIK